jgi:soluble P-type ATPase
MAKWSYVTLLERVAEELGEMTSTPVEEIIAGADTGLRAKIIEQARKDRKVKE